MSDHTTRRWASVLGLMEGPDLYCESVWRLYSLWKHREKRWIWGSGRLGQELLASLWWCLRFNRRTTAAVTDVETHQIISAGVTPPNKPSYPDRKRYTFFYFFFLMSDKELPPVLILVWLYLTIIQTVWPYYSINYVVAFQRRPDHKKFKAVPAGQTC